MREFVELTNIPIYARRAGQGVVSEEHPLAIRGAFKKPFTGGADVVLAIGFRFWSGEHFGQPPTWTDKAKYIQIDPTPTRIGWQVNADLPMVGDPEDRAAADDQAHQGAQARLPRRTRPRWVKWEKPASASTR